METGSFDGYWWIPEGVPQLRPQRLSGSLTIEPGGKLVLCLILDPAYGVRFQAYTNIPVIWGESAGFGVISLFNLNILSCTNFSRVELSVEKGLLGKHILSVDERLFDQCVVSFPFLSDWAFSPRIMVNSQSNDIVSLQIDMTERGYFYSSRITDSQTLNFRSSVEYKLNHSAHSFEANQWTSCIIESNSPCSVSDFLNSIHIFSQFFSFALLNRQSPREISFKRDGSQWFRLIYCLSDSVAPGRVQLIKYDVFKDRLPELMCNWYNEYARLSPIIYAYFYPVLSDGVFEYPSFVVVAEALDGYFKRYLNFKDNKNTKQYKHGVEKILKHFSGVHIIQRCSIDTNVLDDSRHKYVHLVPDEDKKLKYALTEKEDLLVLTQKCRILLVCCILDALGLDTEEINACCDSSPLNYILSTYNL